MHCSQPGPVTTVLEATPRLNHSRPYRRRSIGRGIGGPNPNPHSKPLASSLFASSMRGTQCTKPTLNFWSMTKEGMNLYLKIVVYGYCFEACVAWLRVHVFWDCMRKFTGHISTLRWQNIATYNRPKKILYRHILKPSMTSSRIRHMLNHPT
jgi:hypothetical protein